MTEFHPPRPASGTSAVLDVGQMRKAEQARLTADLLDYLFTVDGNADGEQTRVVYDSLARLPVGEGWVWAPDHEILERVKFPPIKTLDTSKTPKAGDARITAPVLAEADLAKIAKHIAAIEAAQGKPPAKADKAPRLSLVAPISARPPKGANKPNRLAPARPRNWARRS